MEMALSDCDKCWETPCVCGHEYEKYSDEKLRAIAEAVNNECLRRWGTSWQKRCAEIMKDIKERYSGRAARRP